MNEQADNIEYEFLWKLLANPADNNHSHIFNLQSLVNDFPQSGILRALLMPNGDRRNLKHTAAYYDPGILYKLATEPDSLPLVTAEQVVQSDEPVPVPADTYFNVPVAEPFVPPVAEVLMAFSHVTDDTVLEEETTAGVQERHDEPATDNTFDGWKPTPATYPAHDGTEERYNRFSDHEKVADAWQAPESEIEETSPVFTAEENITGTYPAEENLVDKTDNSNAGRETIANSTWSQEIADTGAEAAPLVAGSTDKEKEETNKYLTEESPLAVEYDEYEDISNDTQTAGPVYTFDDKVEYFHQDIDDEIYDEIVSIEDIGLEQLAALNKAGVKEEKSYGPGETNDIKQNSYFVFEPLLEESNHEEVENVSSLKVAGAGPLLQEDSNNDVSKYNDEKMPYTFMWWLDKTRKDHAEKYQPYVVNPNPPGAKSRKREFADELQQQYYENIVSTTSINEVGQHTLKTTATPQGRKENKIIERFIKEEPQIKNTSGSKLDNENKAKQSSEDRDELVTETLARIYTEQMLYHKAIVTYKKLMLKFPEKSLYFAGQIEQLENKIN